MDQNELDAGEVYRKFNDLVKAIINFQVYALKSQRKWGIGADLPPMLIKPVDYLETPCVHSGIMCTSFSYGICVFDGYVDTYRNNVENYVNTLTNTAKGLPRFSYSDYYGFGNDASLSYRKYIDGLHSASAEYLVKAAQYEADKDNNTE